ncbi:MAG: methylenetetrahydrofolate reductase [Thermodesulfobacteriota bacterium]
MSKFSQALAAKDFVLTVELDPPRGPELGPLTELAKELAGKVDAVVISDNREAHARLSPLMAGQALVQHAGAEVVMTLTCRDRNRLALTSDLLAAAAAGVGNLMLVSGDFVSLGDQPGAKPVYDLDSVQLLQLAAELGQGRDLAGGLEGPAIFFLGASLAPEARPLGPQLIKLKKKLAAGAGFLITKPLRGLEGLKEFASVAGELPVKLIAGLEVAAGAEPAEALALAKEIKAAGLAAGVHLAWPGEPQRLPELVGQL